MTLYESCGWRDLPEKGWTYLHSGGGITADGTVDLRVRLPDAIARIDLPERCANLCFGGRQRNRLFMCGSTSMFSLFVNTQGAVGG